MPFYNYKNEWFAQKSAERIPNPGYLSEQPYNNFYSPTVPAQLLLYWPHIILADQ